MKHHLACPLDFGLKIVHFSVTLQQAAWLPFQNLPQWSHAQLCWLKSSNQGIQFRFLTNACLYHQSLETYACQTLVTNKALSTTGHNGQIKQIPPPSLKYMVHTAFILCKCSDERGSSLNMTKHIVCTRPWLLPSPTDINMETPPKQSGDPPFHWDIQPSLSHTPSFLGKSGNALPSRQCSACKWKYWSALLQYLFVLCQAPSYDLYTQCRECQVCRW